MILGGGKKSSSAPRCCLMKMSRSHFRGHLNCSKLHLALGGGVVLIGLQWLLQGVSATATATLIRMDFNSENAGQLKSACLTVAQAEKRWLIVSTRQVDFFSFFL